MDRDESASGRAELREAGRGGLPQSSINSSCLLTNFRPSPGDETSVILAAEDPRGVALRRGCHQALCLSPDSCAWLTIPATDAPDRD